MRYILFGFFLFVVSFSHSQLQGIVFGILGVEGTRRRVIQGEIVALVPAEFPETKKNSRCETPDEVFLLAARLQRQVVVVVGRHVEVGPHTERTRIHEVRRPIFVLSVKHAPGLRFDVGDLGVAGRNQAGNHRGDAAIGEV